MGEGGYSKVKMDEVCLSELLACTVHFMHSRNLKWHALNLFLFKYAGETVMQTEKDVPRNTTVYTLHLTVSNLQFYRIIVSIFSLNDVIRSSDLDRIYWILHLIVLGIICPICCVLCMVYFLQNRHWGLFISNANIYNILTSLATTVRGILDLPFHLSLCTVFIRVPAKGNIYNCHYSVRAFWFG